MNYKSIFSIMVLFLFISQCLFSQSDTIFNQTDKNNLKQGYWKKNYPNGKLMYKGFFMDNKPVGEMRRYYESGHLKAILKYDNKGEYSFAQLFYENGNIAGKGKYFNTLKDSTWEYYSYYNKTLGSKENYNKGKRNGIMINYYPNGDISEKLEWNNNIRSGTWEQYFQGNVLKLKSSYQSDKLHGKFLVYDATGKLFVDGYYKNGLRDGKWTFYNQDGTVKKSVDYLNDKPLNDDKSDAQEQEFFNNIEKANGKYEEPDEINFFNR